MKRVYFVLVALTLIVFGKGQSALVPIGISRPYDPAIDIVYSGLKDMNGNLWFAASGRGVYRYDGKSFTNFTEKDGLSNNNVSCIYEDKTGNLWFGTNGGVCRYDGKSFFSFPILTADSNNVDSFKYSYSQATKEVVSILQDKIGNFWFVTLHHGVYRYDGKSFTNFLSNEVLLCIAEDKNGNILVGSWRHGGVYRYDGKSFTKFNGFSDDMIFCMLEDKAGNIWVGTRDHGVDRYDGKSITNFSEKEGLTNSNVSCIFEDTKGNMWFGSDVRWGTKRGDAFCYDGKSFTNVTAKNSFTTIEGLVYNVRTIVEDNAGNIWFGSRSGLLFSYNGIKFINFSEKVSK
jgi:ligand-binding sensor domain-containing protein